jgi:competence protein ComEA
MMSRLLTRREQIVLGFLAAALLTGSITVFALRRGTPEPVPLVVKPAEQPPAAKPTPATPTEAPAIAEIVVSVQGAVAKPGVYRVDEGSRVNDLIRMAGGLTPGADTSAINLAAHAVDGTTLTIPSRNRIAEGEPAEVVQVSNPDVYAAGGSAGVATAAASGGARLIDLNRASQAELETLPGIGPKLAQQIIQYRAAQPFRSVEDLLDVSGIGEAKLASVRDLVTVK